MGLELILHALQWCHMSIMTSQVTENIIVCPIVYSGWQQRKHQSSTLLVLLRRLPGSPVDSPHKWPITRTTFAYQDVVNDMIILKAFLWRKNIWPTFTKTIKIYLKNKNSVTYAFPDSKVHGANMGPTWVLSAPDGPHVGPMDLAIRVYTPHWISQSLRYTVVHSALKFE